MGVSGMVFVGLVLGCVETKFCKQILVGISYLFEKKALAEIYTMRSFAPFSKLDLVGSVWVKKYTKIKIY